MNSSCRQLMGQSAAFTVRRMEGRNYVNSPAPGRRNRTQQRENHRSCHDIFRGSKCYMLVGVSFCLLCIIHFTLNVSFGQQAVCSNRTDDVSTGNFTEKDQLTQEKDQLALDKKQLTLDKDHLTQEKAQLTQEKAQLTQEKDQLALDKKQLTLDKDHLTQEKAQLTQEKAQLTQENAQLTQEKKQFAQYKDHLLQEKDQLLQGKNQLAQDKKQLAQDKKQLALENDQLTQDKVKLLLENVKLETHNFLQIEENEKLNQKIIQQQNQIKELEMSRSCAHQNTPSCPVGWWTHMSTCYLLSSQTNTWEHARRDCVSKRSHLVVFNDETEERILQELAGPFRMWAGLRFGWYYNTWTWSLVDGSSLLNTIWKNRRSPRGSESTCVYVDQYSQSLKDWSLGPCREQYYWMCEKPQ